MSSSFDDNMYTRWKGTVCRRGQRPAERWRERVGVGEGAREDTKKRPDGKVCGRGGRENEIEREKISRVSCRRALKNVLSPEKAAPVPASAAPLFASSPTRSPARRPSSFAPLTGLLSSPHYLAILASCLPVKPADTAKRYRIGECGRERPRLPSPLTFTFARVDS